MNCYICGQPATGQCQICWKFYCADHGDTVCQPCQGQPGATGTPAGWDRGDTVIGEHRSPRSSRVSRPTDFERQPLQRVIAVGQNVLHGDTEVTLVSLELFEEGFVANFRLRGWGPGFNPHAALPVPGFIRSPTFYAKAADDQGNVYEAFPGSGGGGGGHWRQALRFTPELATAGGHLHVSLDEIQWMAHGAGVRSVIEPGPWEFDVPLE